MLQHADKLKLLESQQKSWGGEAIHQASLGHMCAKRPRDEPSEDSDDELICSRHESKWCCCNDKDHEKYDMIFELLRWVEEHSERMELCATENRKEAFEQAQKALESYNALSERILHTIVNIGGNEK